MPIIMDVPLPLVQKLGMETWLATNGSYPWGGCEVWISSDNSYFKFAQTLQGGSIIGMLTTTFSSAADPETTGACRVDLTNSRGVLLPGSTLDADQGNTICFVCDSSDGGNGEYFSYAEATLTAQYKYDLGAPSSGGSTGYLRRGLYGSAIGTHSSGSNFVRLKPGSYAALPYKSTDVGTTVYIKLLSFNIWGGGKQTLDQVSSYSHTIGGPPSNSVQPISTVTNSAVNSDYPDLASGAASNSWGGQGTPSNITTTGKDMVATLLTTIGQPVLGIWSGFLGQTTNAATVVLSVVRVSTVTTSTIFTSTTIQTSTAAPASFSFCVADSPSAGSNAYTLHGVASSGTVSYSGVNTIGFELRR